MVHESYVDQVVARVETKMLLRGLAPYTVATYIPCVRRFIAWVGKPLGAVKSRDVEQYLLDMVHRDRSPRTRNVNLAATRFALRAFPPTFGGNPRLGGSRPRHPGLDVSG